MKQGKAPYISADTLCRTLEAQHGVHALRDRTILLMSHYLGLRAKEIACLVVGDVLDPASGTVREVIRLFKTKGDKFREAFLVNELTREHVIQYVATRGKRSEAPLFLSQKGGAFSPNTMQKLLARIYARASIDASSHSGRRSFATRLIESGADIYSIMEMMGHSSITTTQTYLTSSPERLKRFASRI